MCIRDRLYIQPGLTIGYLPQDVPFITGQTVAQFVAGEAGAPRYEVDAALSRVEIDGARLANTLSGGESRRAAMARAMLGDPDVLLLDEPTAGMARADTNNTIDLLKQIKEERDITIAIIEHDMHVVFSLAERITVLAQGTPLVEDTPDNIKGHPKVKEAYLGEAA